MRKCSIAVGAAAFSAPWHEEAASSTGVGSTSHRSQPPQLQQKTLWHVQAPQGVTKEALYHGVCHGTQAAAASFIVYGFISTRMRRRQRIICQAQGIVSSLRQLLGSDNVYMEERLLEQRERTEKLETAMTEFMEQAEGDLQIERVKNNELRLEIQEVREIMQILHAGFSESSDMFETARMVGESPEINMPSMESMKKNSRKNGHIAAKACETLEGKQERRLPLHNEKAHLAEAGDLFSQEVTELDEEMHADAPMLKAREQNNELELEVTELRSKINTIEHTKAISESHAARADEERSQLKKRIQEAIARMQAMEAEKLHLQQKVEGLAAVEEEKTTIAQQLSSMVARVDLLEFDRARLKRAILCNAQKMFALKEEGAKLKAELTSNAERMQAIANVEEDRKRLEKKLTAANAKITGLECENSRLKSRISETEKDTQEFANHLRQVEIAKHQAEQQLVSAQAQIAELIQDRE